MKIFGNIFDLINYMSFCPICGSNRKVEVSVGPDYLFSSQRISICYNNKYPRRDSFYTTSLTPNDVEVELQITHGDGFGGYNNICIRIDPYNSFYVRDSYLPGQTEIFMYLQSQCRQCMLRFYSVTSDIDFKADGKLSSLQIEEDIIYVLNNTQVCFDYLNDRVRCIFRKDIITVPMWDENFSNKEKLLQRIKTILTFG